MVHRKIFISVACVGLGLSYQSATALEFDPGVSVGAQFTDNAALTADEKISDVILISSVGATLSEDEGPLVYDTTASLRKESYVNNTFDDKRYFKMGLNVNWEMMRERVDWFLIDRFSQAPVRSIESDTPDNRQDSNIFILGTNVLFPISGRQTVSLVPKYIQNYYQISNTDNRQYSLATNWHYKIFRLTEIGINISGRKIDYDAQSIADNTFFDLRFILSSQLVRSSYTINLGATRVDRDAVIVSTGPKDSSGSTGFVGSLNWRAELSSRSTMEALVSSNITDTSLASQVTSPGDPADVQLSTDVIRNSIVRLTYLRSDAVLHTNIWGEYRKIRYSTAPLNRLIKTFGAQLGFPVTQLVSSGVFLKFTNTQQLDTIRDDKKFDVGVNINANFTSKLNGSFSVQYRTKESTDSVANYDEFSIFVSLSYGFGGLGERTVRR